MSLQARLVVRRPTLELDVHLDVAAGEVVALVGPNGSGKSTTLHALAGLVPLHAGRVVLDGTVLDDVESGTHVHAEARRTGVVFQDHRLFAHLSAAENVAFGLRAGGTRAAAARREALARLAAVGLADAADQRAGRLSGGQAQRVALARTLAVRPRLLLLDEPFAASDTGARRQLRDVVRAHVTEQGLPAVLVTHDPSDAEHLADRVLAVRDGRLHAA